MTVKNCHCFLSSFQSFLKYFVEKLNHLSFRLVGRAVCNGREADIYEAQAR